MYLDEGRFVGAYRIEIPIGEGGMAVVYRARHADTGAAYAVKVLRNARGDLAGRLRREHRAMARLDHPNALGAVDIAEIDGMPALVMELVNGPTLADWMLRHPPSVDESLAVFSRVLAAVGAAHARGLVHRDLKPSNVLLDVATAGLVPKVSDFGLAKVLDDEDDPVATATGARFGTPAYMAPEQMRSARRASARSDLFSLGCLLYEMISGRRTFPQADWMGIFEAASEGRYEEPRTRDGRTPPDHVLALIHGLLEPDPERRIPNAAYAKAILANRSTFRDEAEADPPPVALPATSEAWAVAAGARRRVEAPSSAATAGTWMPATEPHATEMHATAAIDGLYGRAADLAALEAAIASRGAVTIVGTAGVGKTRLLRAATTRCALAGGATFVEIREARTAEALVRAVAVALAVQMPPEPDRAVTAVGAAIASRGPCLVALDNLEQVVDGARATVARWRELAPEAALVGTSREALGIDGERVIAVEPLSEGAAIALLVAEGARAGAKLDPDGPEGPLLAELVRGLDLLPLAIELAAARLAVVSPKELFGRLSARFAVLRRRAAAPGAPATSLQAALDASWDLLDEAEQLALARLSVFRGGFTVEAAESLLADVDPFPLDLVEALVAKSLVRRRATEGASRLDLLVSVSDYAAARLEAAGGRGVAEERHRAWFVRAASAWSEDLEQRADRAHLDVIGQDLDNVVEAARRAAVAAPADAVPLALVAVAYARRCGPAPLEREMATLAADAAREADERLRLRADLARERVFTRSEAPDAAAARALLERAVALGAPELLHAARMFFAYAIRVSDPGISLEVAREALEHAATDPQRAAAWHSIADSLRMTGRSRDAIEPLDRARAAYERHRPWELPRVLLSRAHALRALGELEAMEVTLREMIDAARAAGDRPREAMGVNELGVALATRGMRSEARAAFQHAIGLYRRIGDLSGVAMCTMRLGAMHHDHEAARLLFLEAIDLTVRAGDAQGERYSRRSLALCQMKLGDYEAARSELQRVDESPLAISGASVRTAGWRAIAAARVGRAEEAHDSLARARELRRTVGEIVDDAFLALCDGACALVLGESDAEPLRRAIATVSRAEPPSEAHPEGQLALVQREFDIRFTVHLVDKLLSGAGAS